MLKEKIITIDTGRDAGKAFRVAEMPVSRLEKWACRALFALFGADVPADAAALAKTSNSAALASVVMRGLSNLRWELAEPLYDELLAQIGRIPNTAKTNVYVPLSPDNLDAHVEDVSTIFRLRLEVVTLSLGFLEGGEDWTSRLASTLSPSGFGITRTSPDA